MRLSVICAATIATAAIAFAASTAPGDVETDRVVRSEATRLRAHFDSVLAGLRSRDVSALASEQRRARARLITTLERYRDDGRFPHNHDFPGERVPYFRDEHGTLCAMAFLVASTGRGDIVDDVARRRNNAYVPDLATHSRFSTWLDSVGLTVAEAAWIQPRYDWRSPPVAADDRRSGRYVLPSLAVGATALVSAAFNLAAPRAKKADGALFVGALSGAAMTILGGALLADDPDEEMRTLGVFDVTVGSAALMAVVRRGLRRDRAGAAPPPVAASESRFTIDVVPARHGGQISPAARVELRF